MMSDIQAIRAAIIAEHDRLGRVLSEVVRLAGVREATRFEDPTADPQRLVQCDVALAGLNAAGLAVVSRLRRKSDAPNPFIPILLVGADVRLADVQAAIHFGAHDVLALPLRADQLRARLARAVFAGRPWIDVDSYFGPCRRRVLRAWPHRERRANAEAERAAREAHERRLGAMGWT
jgi:CheY-like chemotaxis protein